MGRKLGAQDSVELSVAVLLDDVDAIVALDERRDFGRERQRAHAHVVDLDSGVAQEIARLDDGVMRRAVREDRELASLALLDDRRRHDGSRRIVLANEAIEIALPDLGHLRVARLLVVAGAAREEAGAGMFGSRQRAIGNAVLVDVAIASPRLHRAEIVGAEHLAAVERLLRIAAAAASATSSCPRSRSLSTKTGV